MDMDIQPANIAQVRRSREGRMVHVDADIGEVAARLRDINPELRLMYSEAGGYFCVYQQYVDGSENLVLTAQECDQRIVNRVLEITQPTYDFGAEMDAQDDASDKARDERTHEQVGEIGERLAHALRSDLGINGHRAFIKDSHGDS